MRIEITLNDWVISAAALKSLRTTSIESFVEQFVTKAPDSIENRKRSWSWIGSRGESHSHLQNLSIKASRHCQDFEYEELNGGGYNYKMPKLNPNVIYQRDAIVECKRTPTPRLFKTWHFSELLFYRHIRLILFGQADWLPAGLTIHKSLGPFFKAPITGLHLIDHGASDPHGNINELTWFQTKGWEEAEQEGIIVLFMELFSMCTCKWLSRLIWSLLFL